jgi:hypothetical protein
MSVWGAGLAGGLQAQPSGHSQMDQNPGLRSVQVDEDVFALAAHLRDPRCDR